MALRQAARGLAVVVPRVAMSVAQRHSVARPGFSSIAVAAARIQRRESVCTVDAPYQRGFASSAAASSEAGKKLSKAVDALFSCDWTNLDPEVDSEVKAILDDRNAAAQCPELYHDLRDAYSVATSVEMFSERVAALRHMLDHENGDTGDNVHDLQEDLAQSLQVVLSRYNGYLSSFAPEEARLQKKVETDLGWQMLQLRQRVNGLDANGWGKLSVLGTCGISGSYIERRR
eukprot:jgi/Mesvir1/11672/Mv00066-RA.1